MRTTLCFGQSDDSLQTFVESILKVPPITNSDSEFEIQLIVDIQLSKRDHFVLIKKNKVNGMVMDEDKNKNRNKEEE